MKYVVGIDEVGRGCWAGPLVAAAVILARPMPGLRDSKKLNKNERQRLAKIIHEQALAIGFGWVEPQAIDKIGLTASVSLAMQQAIDMITLDYDQLIIDGHYNFLPLNKKATTLIRADDLIPCVSAASIIAKVARDTYMAEAAKEYPDYHFDQNVGYGTKQHLESMTTHGITTLHRTSYKPVKAIINAAPV